MRKCLQFLKCPTNVVNTVAAFSLEQVKEVIMQNDIQKLQQILENKIDFEQDLFFFALTEAKQEVAMYLLKEKRQIIDFQKRNDKGDSTLMIAIYKHLGQRLVEELVRFSDVNAYDFNKNTAFIFAAANGNQKALFTLKSVKDNDCHIKNYDGQTALHRACYFGELQAVKYLIKNTNLKIAQIDKKGNNCLHLACMGLNLALTRYIMKKVKNSIKILVPNKEGKTPYDIFVDNLKEVNSSVGFKDLNLSHLEQRSVQFKTFS